jgi:uncharacterized protein
MRLTAQEKDRIKKDLVQCLRDEPEVRRVIVFGSFVSGESPNDLDVAVVQDSGESYLPLAMKYRRLTSDIASRIAMDILPVRYGVTGGVLAAEIARGEVVFER